jgi:hypothetical protein
VSGTTYTFGSSGFLFRSKSLWHNLTGEPVVGSLANSGIKLQVLPVVILTWEEWLREHPETVVLDIDTGHQRDYTPGKPYGDYFARPDTMFPVSPRDRRLPPKSYVFALRLNDHPKAYPLAVLGEKRIVNDVVGGTKIVILADTANRTARAYERQDYNFLVGKTPQEIVEQRKGEVWQVQEEYLVNPQTGERLPRRGGHVSYWFGWYAFYPRTEVYSDE